jgi:hypothetical protein
MRLPGRGRRRRRRPQAGRWRRRSPRRLTPQNPRTASSRACAPRGFPPSRDDAVSSPRSVPWCPISVANVSRNRRNNEKAGSFSSPTFSLVRSSSSRRLDAALPIWASSSNASLTRGSKARYVRSLSAATTEIDAMRSGSSVFISASYRSTHSGVTRNGRLSASHVNQFIVWRTADSMRARSATASRFSFSASVRRSCPNLNTSSRRCSRAVMNAPSRPAPAPIAAALRANSASLTAEQCAGPASSTGGPSASVRSSAPGACRARSGRDRRGVVPCPRAERRRLEAPWQRAYEGGAHMTRRVLRPFRR